MENSNPRNDKKYKEIEEFQDYELTQCVAYEMAIRAPLIRKILEEKPYENNTESSKKGILYPTDENKRILKVFKDHGLELSSVLNENYKNNTGKIQSFFVKHTQNGLHKIQASFAKNGIQGVSINNINPFSKAKSENDFSKIPECNILMSRPPLKLKTANRIMLDINLSLPFNEIIAQVTHIKNELVKSKSAVISPVDIFSDVTYTENNRYPKKPKAQKIADWFFVYDSYQILKKETQDDDISIFGDIDTQLFKYYHNDGFGDYYSVETYRKTILPTMKHFIDDLGYKELLTSISSL